jgi:hypothetical protein
VNIVLCAHSRGKRVIVQITVTAIYKTQHSNSYYDWIEAAISSWRSQLNEQNQPTQLKKQLSESHDSSLPPIGVTAQ